MGSTTDKGLPYFATIDFSIRLDVYSAAIFIKISHVSESKILKIPNKNSAEAILVELCAATTDLANSANIAVSRMALRSKLAAAIADAGKAERAAEALRTVATYSAKNNGT